MLEKGVDKDVAAEALEEFISRKEAQTIFVTKTDLESATRWLIATFIGIALGQMAVMTGIMALMFSLYAS